MIIETLFAGSDQKINAHNSVFLAGPSPKDGDMLNGWRRQFIKKFESIEVQHTNSLQLIIPEPETGYWNDVMTDHYTEKDQTLWEHEKMVNSKVVAFWLPTFWTPKNAGSYPANIGPSSRFEFGFFLSNAIRNQNQKIIVGSPHRAESLNWAKILCEKYGIHWHYPDTDDAIPNSFFNAIINAVKD
jgi:hypothetical protein